MLGPRTLAGSRLPVPGAYPEPALVGHDHALRRLRSAWRAAYAGTGQMVSLVGEIGSGRSRLIRELGSAIDELAPSALWVVGQAHSYATYSAYGLLAELLAPWTDDRGGAGVAANLATALTTLAEGAPADAAARLEAAVEQVNEARHLDKVAPDGLASALAEALPRVAGSEPIILVLEDLEWADAASLAVLDLLLPALLAGQTLVLCTHHADWSHEWPDVPRHYHLILGSLSQEESRRLAEQIAGDIPLEDGRLAEVVTRAGGGPLLLEQAVYVLRERNAAPAGEADPLAPATLHEAILARIEALPTPARDVLVAAAVLGQSFAYDAVAAVIGERAELDAGLRELVRRRFVQRWSDYPDVTYRFTHGFIQEVAYSSLRRPERQVLEARVADWLLRDSAGHGASSAQARDDLMAMNVSSHTVAPDESPLDSADVADMPGDTGAAATPVDDIVTSIWPAAMQQGRRNAVLARIALGDLTPDRRASVVLCLQHGYSYSAAGELLGLPSEEVRAHLYEARLVFQRLYEANEVPNVRVPRERDELH